MVERNYLWTCHQCGDAPKNWATQPACVNCGHVACKDYCTWETEKQLDNFWASHVARQDISDHVPIDPGPLEDAAIDLATHELVRDTAEDRLDRFSGPTIAEPAEVKPAIFRDTIPTQATSQETILDSKEGLETASVGSFADSGYGSTSSPGRENLVLSFTDELAKDFVDNTRLSRLLISCLDSDVNKNQRIRFSLLGSLRQFSLDLKIEATTAIHRDAYRLVRSRASYLAWAIIFHLGFPLLSSGFESLQSEQVDKLKVLERFLADRHSSRQESESNDQREDEISDGEEDDETPNLAQIRRFLFSGPSFEQLLRRLSNERDFFAQQNEGDAAITFQRSHESRDRGVSNSQPSSQEILHPDALKDIGTYRNSKFAEFRRLKSALRRPLWLRRLFEPPAALGMIRIRWTCRCGKELYDDYKELVPGAVADLEQQFIRHFNTPASHSGREPVQRRGLPAISIWLVNAMRGLCKPFKDGIAQSLPVTRPMNGTPHLSMPNRKPLFLLLCTHLGLGREVQLVQGDTEDTASDQDLFLRMKSLYDAKQGRSRMKRFFTLQKIQEIRFVHFELLYNDIVNGLTNVPRNFWPDSSAYEFDLSSCKTHPPIAPNVLRHLFENPSHADPLVFLTKRIPRKREEELRICQIARYAEGWGLYLAPGVNWAQVSMVALLFLLLSLVFGVIWGVLRNFSEGFQFASCLMVLITFTAGSVHGRFG